MDDLGPYLPHSKIVWLYFIHLLRYLKKLQNASTALQVKDLYHSLKIGGHLLPVNFPDLMQQIECTNWDLDYNGNVVLSHFGGERNRLVAFESSPDGNCLFNSLSLLMFGWLAGFDDRIHMKKLYYSLDIYIRFLIT